MGAGKLPRLIRSGTLPRTESCANWGGPIAMVPCQGNIYIQRKLRVWREQKCIPLVGAETPLTCAGRQTTPFHAGRYRAKNENLRRLGWSYRHGTVFAPRQSLYPKEGTGMERTEMYSTSRWSNPTFLYEPANYPISWGAVLVPERKFA